ncbi:hypothetical protein ANN_19453 [Periplaneta americana]|uniref:Uncharacterized protein n=1 Tax=Periplaneta americana TaxID=6978 RepID=A0ABQ8SA92_PERAM|nr:hypothetical protein ANN_19453 [Periplaneta americana]
MRMLETEVLLLISIRRPEFECSGPQWGPEFECSGPQLEGPEFECSGPQLEGPEFEYSELSLKERLKHTDGVGECNIALKKPRNIDDLRVKTTQAFRQIIPLMLQRTWAELHHRYELCRVRNGDHVEL